MREEILQTVQDLPVPRSEVFSFFADPANLECLTPPWLNFRIVTPPPLPSGEGAIFEYRLKVRGLPVRWRTLIEVHVEGERFVDRQLAGPYALWLHTHLFEDLPSSPDFPRGGTRITDRVRYRIGWGLLGSLVHYLWVRRDLEAIFSFRRKAIVGVFGAVEKAA